jgi:hypothetical protein
LIVGCQKETASNQTVQNDKAKTKAQAKPADEQDVDSTKSLVKRSGLKKGSLSGGSSSTHSSYHAGFSENDAVDRLFDVINDSLKFQSTFVIFCFDETPSAKSFVQPVQDRLKTRFAESATDEGKLLLGLYGFAADAHPLSAEPIANADQLDKALQSFASKTSDNEAGISAAQQAFDAFKSYQLEKNYKIIMVIVSDEAPTDRDKLEPLIKSLSSSEVITYVIGKPAPFGRTTVSLARMPESSVVYGPETADVERINTDYWQDGSGLEMLDSGFGPWAYERLCRQTQGRFLAVRDDGGGGFVSNFERSWPLGSQQFDPSVMSRYPPDYRTLEEYEASVASNAALRALVATSKLPRAKFVSPGSPEVMAGDEAALARDLLRYQQQIAAGSAPIKNMYDTLKAGEADRDKLENLRWKISYDLALARATANYVRLDGANAMMAKAKGGMRFTDSSNNLWRLEPSDEVDSGGTHKRMAEDARSRLEEIVKNYPGTPWALIAERELEAPLGWKWIEDKR